MIRGRVTIHLEATIQVEVVGPEQRLEAIEAVIDTGFNGFLTLPSHLVHALQLLFVGHRRVQLGDGSSVVLDLYLASLVWNGEVREVVVLQAEGGPLVGMSLLQGHRVILHVIDNGEVIVDAVP